MSKPKVDVLDPSRVSALLAVGDAEVRPRPALVPPPAPASVAAAPGPAPAPSPVEPEPPSAVEAAAAKVSKEPITVRLSKEVLVALFHHQAEVRSLPGKRLGESTIGAVIDQLLRTHPKLNVEKTRPVAQG